MENKKKSAQPTRQLRRPSGNFIMSTFTLINSTLGAGMLGVPLAYAKAGLVLAICMNVLVEMIAFCTMYFLLVVADACGVYSLGGLAAKLFGMKGLLLVEMCTFLNCFGGLWAYIILISDFVPSLLKVAGVPEDSVFVQRFFIIIVVGVAVLQLLGWFRTLDALKFTSFLGTISMALCISVIVVRCISHAPGTPLIDPPVLIQTNIKAIQTLSTLIFSICCHQNVPLVLSEYKGRSKPAMTKVLMCQVLIVSSFYITAGSFGYMCFTSQYFTHPTPGNILTMFQEKDILPILARCGSLITVIFCFPVQMLPARMALINITSMIKKMIAERNQPKDSKGRVRTFIKIKTATTNQIITEMKPPLPLEEITGGQSLKRTGQSTGNEHNANSEKRIISTQGSGANEAMIPFRRIRTQSEVLDRHAPIGRGREVAGRLHEMEKEMKEEQEKRIKSRQWNVLSRETKSADDPNVPAAEEGDEDNGEKEELMLDEKEQEKLDKGRSISTADASTSEHEVKEYTIRNPSPLVYVDPAESVDHADPSPAGQQRITPSPCESATTASQTSTISAGSQSESERLISPLFEGSSEEIATPTPFVGGSLERLEEEFYMYPPPQSYSSVVERDHYLPIPSFALIFGGSSSSNEEFDYEYRFVGGDAPPGAEEPVAEEGRACEMAALNQPYQPAQMGNVLSNGSSAEQSISSSSSSLHSPSSNMSISSASSTSSLLHTDPNMVEVTRGIKKKPWGKRTCCGPCTNGLFLSCVIGSCLTAIAMVLGNFIPTVNLVFDIVGSTAGVAVVFLFPSALYLQFMRNTREYTTTKRYYDPAIPDCYRKNKLTIEHYRNLPSGCTFGKTLAVILLVAGSVMGLFSLAMAVLFDTSLHQNLNI